ncbi:SDR family oxidoreductase [Phenylobacterium soli]|uniref:D-xylose 1-dehydrogenase n=1 Tax=Phenylobacterium soli TaxID=2170551 RepID=A0A328AR03_9CAUL|nr:SDR family oxidoreductase [Phenylobacterium soli]RAK56166.1 short-chain dehydrogenase [Phenylobacterium soli]
MERTQVGKLFDLAGKVAIITGSSRGIGKAIAEQMAAHGAKVVISSRKAGPCEEVAAEINARSPGHAIAVPANISSKDDLTRLVEETRKAFGKIDIVVCNAASNPFYGSQLDISDDAFRKILENNIIANNWLVQLTAPEMKERKDGAVIIVSSIGGLRGSTVIGAYCISKAADMQLARNLAQELGPHNIRVNCIAPGLVKTDFARALWDTPEGEKRASSGTPLRRLGDPDDIAGAAVFLASKAGSWMTGQTVVIDGGSTC